MIKIILSKDIYQSTIKKLTKISMGKPHKAKH